MSVLFRAQALVAALAVASALAPLSPADALPRTGATSAGVTLPTLCPRNVLARPRIAMIGTTPASNGLTRYDFRVVNLTAYPNCLFAAAPQLPPCGNNANASRTWVDVYAGTPAQRVYGFCSLHASADLAHLWFARPAAQPPGSFFIVMTDRLLHRPYRSNTLTVP